MLQTQAGLKHYKIWVVLLWLFGINCVNAASVQSRHYPDLPTMGQPFYVAVTWNIPNDWHMETPSEGMPQFTWTLPKGLTFKRWYWPQPQPFSSAATGGQSLGYTKCVTALAEFQVSEPFHPEEIQADIRWALCNDQCVLHNAITIPKEAMTELQWLDGETLLTQSPTSTLSPTPFVFAWLGGLILNVMPCVLPVLSLKVLDFLKPTTFSPWLRGLAFTGGVCTGFAILGGIITAFQYTGTHVLGWGFHMQSPWFIGIMMLLFLLMGFNLWGAFEVGASLTRISMPTWIRHPIVQAWGMGLVTCAVSTPCTAPFMGSALVYGLTASPSHLMGILLCLGLGLSTPMLVLTLIPGWIRLLPKPGIWMVHFKRVLSVGFFLTACWLSWVLSSLTFSPPTQTSAAHIEQLLDSDQRIMLDFTADWCLTCQTNKHVLHDPDIQELLNKNKVQVITIDLTQHNPEGSKLLQRFQRSAIPLMVYSKGRGEYTILPPLLTHGDIINLFPATATSP